MTLYLVRHAKAGSRSNYEGPDHTRPLTRPGRRQAIGIAQHLLGAELDAVVSSPYVRCVQTLEPLAWLHGLPVDVAEELAEGTPAEESLTFLKDCSNGFARALALCTHGDVLGDLVDALTARPEVVVDGPMRLEKGCIWAFDTADGEVVAARYVPPPD